MTKPKTISPRFLWQLSRREVMEGVKAFMRSTGLRSGSLSGAYDLYSAALHEWQKAKRKNNDG